MADTKTSDLAALSSPASGDLLPGVDVSDTSMAASGTNKKLTLDGLDDYLKTTAKVIQNKTLGNGNVVPWEIQVACSDQTTEITAGTAKVSFTMPWAATLTAIKADVNAAPTGSDIEIDVNEGGTTVLTQVITIEASELSSLTATTPPNIGGAGPSLADAAVITIDFDQVGSTFAGTGVIVTLSGVRTL